MLQLSFCCKENSFECFNVIQHLSNLNQGEKLLKFGFLSQKFKNPKLKFIKICKCSQSASIEEINLILAKFSSLFECDI